MISQNSGFSADYNAEDSVLRIELQGEIDHHSAVGVRADMDALIYRMRARKVELVLSGIGFMDSSGLGLVMGRYTLVKELGGAFAVVDPSPAIMRIFKLAGMERLIHIETTKQEGDGSIRHKAG